MTPHNWIYDTVKGALENNGFQYWHCSRCKGTYKGYAWPRDNESALLPKVKGLASPQLFEDCDEAVISSVMNQ